MSLTKKDAYYFSHDSNARNDVKLIKLRRNLGAEGYGIYWMIIESLREQSEYHLLLDSISDLAFEYHVDEAKLINVITNYDLFVIGNTSFYSNRLKRSMDEYNSKKLKLSEAGKKGNSKRWDKIAETPVIAPLSPGDPNPIALKERKGNKGNKEKENRRVFTPPSFDEVRQYFEIHGYSEEVAKKAFDYYEAGDWKDRNGKQVRIWKQKMNGVWFKEENLSKSVNNPTMVY